MINSRNTQLIKDTALQLGFSACGIAKAERLHEDAIRLENWLKKGNHGSMHYMENYFDKRIDPTLLVDDAKSVITLLMNYYPAEKQHTDSFKISKYAYGNDYHDVIKEKLNFPSFNLPALALAENSKYTTAFGRINLKSSQSLILSFVLSNNCPFNPAL